MTDYSELSDLDINTKIFKLTEKFKNECEDIDFDINKNELSWGDGDNWHKFNPCNNPSDAWPIIVENKISLIPSINDELYRAAGFRTDFVSNENPLRAAMIVYLMMQEQNND